MTHPIGDVVRMFDPTGRTGTYFDAVALEPAMVEAIVEKVEAVVRGRLTTKRSTAVAPIYDALGIRADGISLAKWADARVPLGNTRDFAFGKIMYTVAEQVAIRLKLSPGSVSIKSNLASSKLTVEFAEPVRSA